MKASSAHSFIILSVLSSVTSAWPLLRSPMDLVRRAPQSYSVVAVDGGNTATATAPSSPTTKTVTDAITQTQIKTSVLLSTIIATQSNSPPATTVVPQTVTFATTVLETSSASASASAPAQVTVTVSPTLSAYDNGQWHTTYYFKSTSAPAANANDVAPAPTSTTSFDPAQWAAWSGKNNGQYNTK